MENVNKWTPTSVTMRGKRNYSPKTKTICNINYNKMNWNYIFGEKDTVIML